MSTLRLLIWQAPSWAMGPQLQALAEGLGCSVSAPRGSKDLSQEAVTASAEERKTSSAGWRDPGKLRSPGRARGHGPAATPPALQLCLSPRLSLSPGRAEPGTFP